VDTIKEKKAGRKYKIILSVMICTTLLMVLPPTLSWAGLSTVAPLISGGEYVSLMLGFYGLYVGGNVMQKKVLSDAGVSEEEPGEE